MNHTKQIQKIIKKRSKSQRLKKTFQGLIRSDPKSDRKNSSGVKESFSYNNIKIKKEKPVKNNIESVKTKVKNPKAKAKEHRSHNSLIEDNRNSVSQDIKTTVVYKDQLEKRDEIIKEQEDTIRDLREELKFLNYKLKRMEDREMGEEQEISERKNQPKAELEAIDLGKIKMERLKHQQSEQPKEIEKESSPSPPQEILQVQTLLTQIQNLQSQVLAQTLMKQELVLYIQKMKKAHKIGMVGVVNEVKKVLLKKVGVALANSRERINQVVREQRGGNVGLLEKMLGDLPMVVEREFERQLGV